MPSPAAPRRVAILLHARDRHARAVPYRIWSFAKAWRREGRAVAIHCGLPLPHADVRIAHLDLSRLPAEYVQAFAAAPDVVNGRVTDVRKRSVSRHLVRPGDDWQGPVIVKSDENAGGAGDRRILRRGRRPLWLPNFLWRGVRARHSARDADPARSRHLAPKRYRVFAGAHLVPAAVYANEHVVVERLFEERDGDDFVLRSYSCLGDRSISHRVLAHRPIVKGNVAHTVLRIEDEPEVVAWRQRLALDYGKLDYIEHAGGIALIDVNPTPTYGPVYGEALQREIVGVLAPGIEALAGREDDEAA